MNKSIFLCSFFLVIFSCGSLFSSKKSNIGNAFIDSIQEQDLRIFNAISKSIEKIEAKQEQNRLWKEYWEKRDQIKFKSSTSITNIIVTYWLELILLVVLCVLILITLILKKKISSHKPIDDTEFLFQGFREDFEEESIKKDRKGNLEQNKKSLMQDYGISQKSLDSEDLLDDVIEDEQDLDDQIREQLSLQQSSLKNLQSQSFSPENKEFSNNREASQDKKIFSEKGSAKPPSSDWDKYQTEDKIKNDILRFNKKGYTPSQISNLLKVDLRDVQNVLSSQKGKWNS